MAIVKKPGRQPSRSEQLILTGLIDKRSNDEVVIIHHITEDTPHRMQVEVERRCPQNGLAFERIVL